ncbi:MAG: hypothetical protein ACWGQW_11930 [bacterium]
MSERELSELEAKVGRLTAKEQRRVVKALRRMIEYRAELYVLVRDFQIKAEEVIGPTHKATMN